MGPDGPARADFSASDARVSGGVLTPGAGKCPIEVPEPFGLVVFGASGDLTKRKIMPAVYRLFCYKLLPENFFVMGAARTALSDDAFRAEMREAIKKALPGDFNAHTWDDFARRMYYCRVEYSEAGSYGAIKDKLGPAEQAHRTGGNRIFYLAVPPTVYEDAILNIGEAGLAAEQEGYSHIVIEKPFGRDTASARKLNIALRRHFQEPQIYRMDHYLAKETVQSLLIFRFANSIFEPLWNRHYIDHVQISVAETLGVEHRAGYYEHAGVIRDMFQNHTFQLLALTAMEPPSAFEADRVRDEKVKVFHSIRPFELNNIQRQIVLGQYGSGHIGARPVVGYRGEPGVNVASVTPTFAAMKVYIDNWRWNGVPFYLRSGKRLGRRSATISIHFRPVPHIMFAEALPGEIEPSTLVMRIQPDEGISLEFQTKQPGTKICLNKVLMDFSYQKAFSLDAYERVLMDCMQGDRMLFVREDGVNLTWSLLSPVIERLEAVPQSFNFPNYASGSDGPKEAAQLIERDGRKWRQA